MGKPVTGLEHPSFELIPPYPWPILLDLLKEQFIGTGADEAHLRFLLQERLPPLIRLEVLSLILGISPKLLYAMAHEPNRYYRRFELPKRGGKKREIATPRVFLKVVQRWLLRNILYKTPMPGFVTGFVPTRGILSNGAIHARKKYLARLDIKDFFPSIGLNQTVKVFQKMGYSRRVALQLAKLCLLDGKLPQGAPTSPQLANLVFLPTDIQVNALCKRFGIAYSRYADDLGFSSDDPIKVHVLQTIRKIIRRSGFQINEEKTAMTGPGQRHYIAGMVVNDRPQPMRILRRQLRARFHQARLHPRRFKRDANQLLGWAAFVHMYDKQLGTEYLKIARDVAEHASIRSK